ncbi:glycosyltransferase family 4 protein [Teredinibacter purpureus]|uniref:glycosyltransferase family 4 protein n=1 Tax=Teredinibacter purpureus TaxID=2731756 RepID=UPI0005F80EB8|nr:glycosyltransferase family 4 protein [Teredinibacter purpureus]
MSHSIIKPIKVLQLICPTGYYGAERWIVTLAKSLDATAIQCDLAVTVEPNMEELKIVGEYRATGQTVHEVKMNNRFDLGVILRLKNLIREKGYTLIHTHGYKSDILGLIAGRLAGVTTISTPHGFENAEDWKLRAYIALGNKTLKHFDVVAPLSEELCADVRALGVKENALCYIKNGVDLEEASDQIASASSNLRLREKKKKRVGFIGQMISRKNIFDLLDIFNSLSAENPELELILLGDGDERAELERYAHTLAATSQIQFLGFRDDRIEWLQSFDLFVMTSTLEGIPRCLMESMAMGIPVAAYKIAGIDQLLFHNETGLLAELGDKAALEDCWKTLLYDTAVADRIASSARDYVMKEFSGNRMADDYTRLYRKLSADIT